MSEKSLMSFAFEDHAVRVVRDEAGEPWFVAADVCAVLELPNTTRALARLDADEQALISIQGISRGNDQVNVVNESGLYALILGSRKASAKRFKRWVTHEVLPSIRKTGSYHDRSGEYERLREDERRLREIARLVRHYAAIHASAGLSMVQKREAIFSVMWMQHGIDLTKMFPMTDVPPTTNRQEDEPVNRIFLETLCALQLPVSQTRKKKDGTTYVLQVTDIVAAAITRVVVYRSQDDEKALARLGLCVKFMKDMLYLVVAVRNQELATLLRDTRWYFNGSWGAALREVPGVQKKVARFPDKLAKAYFVPFRELPLELNDGDRSEESQILLNSPNQLM
ncbi:MAG: BRO-N domain-containing protein [Acidithiobacillus sp.]